jgi:2-polyprenyl-6-methoxyphenol hydroxylase-like FAD-dependent oxidoreductase
METSNNRQVLIVGAGPTGLVAAIELARRGVSCRIIDRLPVRPQSEIEDAKRILQSRAIAVQARTLECFEMMGIDVDAFIASGQPMP